MCESEESVKSKSIVEFLYTSNGGLTNDNVPPEALVMPITVN